MNIYFTSSPDSLIKPVKTIAWLSQRIQNLCILLSIIIVFSGCSGPTENACEWPSFHGPDRTNKSAETGLMKAWPLDGPELLWTVSGLGEGYSSVSIAGGHIYTAGTAGDTSYVFAFDLNGNPVWKKPNGETWSTNMSHARSYTGSRSTPTYDNGVVFHLGESGRLAAFDSKTGEELWQKEFVQEFDAANPEYGYAESVLIDGDHLYTQAAGKKGFIICLNKKNGKLIWANQDIPGLEGYASPVIKDLAGYRQVLGASSNCYYGVDSKTGRLLWKVDFENQRGLNVPDAIVHNEYVFISSGYGKGSMLLKLNVSGNEIRPETVWQSELMDNHHGGVILHEGYLYGSGSNSRGWFCLDFMTGEPIWKTEGKGSITFADGMLYLLDERGTMRLVRATPDKYEVSGEFKVPGGGKGMYWAHPVVCDKRLYVRHADKLYAYHIEAKGQD
jgi:outer membrane protein assembly factor BamB